jgi:hypothetical protein
MQKTNDINNEVMSYIDYYKNNIDLKKYKIPALKSIAKQNKLHVSGNKTDLTARIVNYFNRCNKVTIIQRKFRRSMVRHCSKLHGPALNNRKLCVNDTDFVTMAPLVEIENHSFFSYTDVKQFTYGFDVCSLAQLLKSKGKLYNPYNREKMENVLVGKIITLYRLRYIINPEFKKDNEPLLDSSPRSNAIVYNRRSTPIRVNRPVMSINPNSNILQTNIMPQFSSAVNIEQNSIQMHMINRLLESRIRKTFEQRINDIFTEFDQLGNYTNSLWFFRLSHRDFYRLYRHLVNIWNYRGQIPRDVRLKICPFTSPFSVAYNIPLYLGADTLPLTDNTNPKFACIDAFENILFTGADDEYRKIGAFHLLSALTIVSSGARNAMPWLYESVIF